LKEETSLVVVSRRRTSVNLSYILIADSAETVLDARAFDTGGEPAADFLSQSRGDLVAQKGGDVLGLDGEHGLTGELLIKRRQHRLRAEDQIGGIFDLH
jgi:hypothetical protein